MASPDENQQESNGGAWAAYCPAHADLCRRYDRDFGPFPGCPGCPRAESFDIKTQPHLAAAQEKLADV